MERLDAEENLIAAVARATCLGYRLDPNEVPAADVDLYVEELVALYGRKPQAHLFRGPDEDSSTLADTVRFCAEQLKEVAPQHASRLLSLLAKDR
jgi:hypothetical protein